MNVDLFDYDLPPDRIAQEPLPVRDASKLLVYHRKTDTVEHLVFRDIPRFLGPEHVLIRNNASVLPGRLMAKRATGGNVECLLLRPTSDPRIWKCLLRPGRKLADGSPFGLPGEFEARALEQGPEGEYSVQFNLLRDPNVLDLARRLGAPPLPPYIERSSDDPRAAMDRERYQTVYASGDRPVAAAAPTAGLHFTPQLLETLRAKGVEHRDVTLHVGLGTFRPIQTDKIEEHAIHREFYEVPAETAALCRKPAGRQRVAVGTTVVRTLEDFIRRATPHPPGAFSAEADIYIYPPFDFRAVDALITNFHQPRSTLLCLVSAFLKPGSSEGIGKLQSLYREAIARSYRFLSYGDAMLIL